MSRDSHSQTSRVVAIVVSAGTGARFGSTRPKQFQQLGHATVVAHAVRAFALHERVDATVLVTPPGGDVEATATLGDVRVDAMVDGGETRQQSVFAGLQVAGDMGAEKVLIHDAARPLVSAALISDILDALDRHQGAVPALPVPDTLVRSSNSAYGEVVDREELFRVQTPQGFDYPAIMEAHRTISDTALTDDAQIAQAAGHHVALVPGDEHNIKITYPNDLERAERLMEPAMQSRTGFGYDVHRLVPGHSITLCGLVLESDHSLEGHSDADVALHALVDAILGALGAGDIGAHFPPTDERWKGAASGIFVEAARDLVAERGGRIANVDVTLVCETPRIGPHRDAMRARVAELLDIEPERVSVKATTSERLGFVGRREGIAAHAIATVEIPRL